MAPTQVENPWKTLEREHHYDMSKMVQIEKDCKPKAYTATFGLAFWLAGVQIVYDPNTQRYDPYLLVGEGINIPFFIPNSSLSISDIEGPYSIPEYTGYFGTIAANVCGFGLENSQGPTISTEGFLIGIPPNGLFLGGVRYISPQSSINDPVFKWIDKSTQNMWGDPPDEFKESLRRINQNSCPRY